MLPVPENALIWFAIVVFVATEISLIAPPVGMDVIVVNDVSLGTILKAALPFWIADIVRLTILILMPSMTPWLVGAMYQANL